jgi:hypothetical protein
MIVTSSELPRRCVYSLPRTSFQADVAGELSMFQLFLVVGARGVLSMNALIDENLARERHRDRKLFW